jgi:ATP-dependent helicase HrpA
MEGEEGRPGADRLPALLDKGGHVEIEVFDEPEAAAEKHRVGLRRLFALQLRTR